MKSSLLRAAFALCLSAALGPVGLIAQSCITAAVPFDFTVGAKSFAAGDYCIKQVADHVLLIQTLHGSGGIMEMTVPSDPVKENYAVLVFKRYNDTYFLSRVSDGGRGWQFRQSRAEKELLAKQAHSDAVNLTASVPLKQR